jgi:hypothetical protein
MVARNADLAMVSPMVESAQSAFGRSLESGSQFCVGAFGRNLDSFTMKMFSHLIYFIKKLEEYLQCYCREIKQMRTFLINLACPKGYHRPDHSIHIVEYHRKHSLTQN